MNLLFRVADNNTKCETSWHRNSHPGLCKSDMLQKKRALEHAKPSGTQQRKLHEKPSLRTSTHTHTHVLQRPSQKAELLEPDRITATSHILRWSVPGKSEGLSDVARDKVSLNVAHHVQDLVDLRMHVASAGHAPPGSKCMDQQCVRT